MKILSSQADRFNELVFEHRNKDYGTYVIRKTYSDTMVKACFITFSTVALLLGTAVVANNLSSKGPVVEIPKTTDENVWDTVDLVLKEKKQDVPVEPQIQKPLEQASAAPNTALPTEVVEAVVTHSTDVEDPHNGQGDAGALGTSATATATTGSTLAATPATITVASDPQAEVVWSEVMPEYEGGLNGLIRFLSANIVYPEQAKLVGKEGTVYISFVVDENGYVTGAKVVRGIGFGCDEEALRVVSKMPKWKSAGMNAGKPVRVRFNLPVKFTLK